MNENGAFIASLLDSSRKAYAAGAVTRFQEAGPEAARFVEEWGFNALVDDTQIRLEHLAEALACGRPELLALDVGWLSATYAAREVPPELLRSTLACLRDELAESLPPGAADTARAYLEQAIEGLEREPTASESLLESDEPHAELARRFLLAVLDGNRGDAEKVVLHALQEGVAVSDLHFHVITRVQAEVGRMWQAGDVQVAEEHFGSRIVEDVLAGLRTRMERGAEAGSSVLVASVAGNLHDIGARIVADHFEMSGWRSVFLGANMPVGDLVQAVHDFEPDLVALSVGLAINVRAAADTIAALRAEFPGKPILVGGRPFAHVADLWKDVGADGCAPDAATAVRTGNELVSAGLSES